MFLKRNCLETLPKEFFTLKNLQEIDLSENNFSFIPAVIFVLPVLKKINLCLNKITNFELKNEDNTIFILEKNVNFEYLYLSNNLIKDFPTDLIKHLIKIKHLSLDFNAITDIPKEVINNLKTIYKNLTYTNNDFLQNNPNANPEKEEIVNPNNQDGVSQGNSGLKSLDKKSDKKSDKKTDKKSDKNSEINNENKIKNDHDIDSNKNEVFTEFQYTKM